MLLFNENQIIAGKYKLERQVARGGMGAVWTARNLQLNIPVAVKFMAPEAIGSAELVARFEREARAAAQLRSPHVVHIYEHGVVGNTPFMVMELLEGEDLSKRLRTRGRLSMAETTRIAVQVCKALRRAHEMNIVHRDLKPGNVFLCRQDEEELVKVLDFGIAKILVPGPEEEVTKTGALVGTPHYMSPEQARRSQKDVDHRTDLWALGVIAFRALTGRLPFAGETAIDVLLRVCNDNEPIPPPSSIASDLGPEVDRFFARALARRPEARFQSAREMAEAMTALLPRSTGAAHPLGQSWAESGANPPVMLRAPTSGAPAQSSQPAQPIAPISASPRGSVPDVHVVEAKVYTSPAAPSAPRPPERPVDTHDPLGIAPTVPIARSPAGQALLRAAPGSSPGGTLPLDSPPIARAPASRAHPGMPPAQAVPRPDGSGGWPAQPPAPQMQAAAPQAPFVQAAGDVAGTITSAASETAPMWSQRRRSSWIVWAATAAVVLVVSVVGWAVFAGRQPPESDPEVADSPPLIPLPIPPPREPPAPDPPPPASASAPVPATASASASATVSVAPAASTSASRATPPSAKPVVSPNKSGTPPAATTKDKNNSGMMGAPTF